jgi:hypothetical protein
MIKTSGLLLLLIASSISFSQVHDDFSDDNFTSNPAWLGDTSSFQITSSSAIPPELKPALQLNSEGSDTSILYLPNNMMMNTEWRFWIKMSFNTSANNFARIYLVSDQENLEGDLNGYFVQVGGTEDSIALFKQTGNNFEKIITGTIAYTGNSTNVLRIKVTHDQDDIWQLYSATDGGYDFELEGTSADNSISTANYFGLYCKYTSSNCTKFYFDDFYVDEIIVDTIPPEISNLLVVSDSTLDIYFNESVELSSAQDTANYFVNNFIGHPSSATRDAADFSLVHLVFEPNFVAGINYTLTVDDVADLSGNYTNNETGSFQYFPSAIINPWDIVINEIMADENPLPAGLPEADYLELYNRTGQIINLENCTIKPRETADPVLFPSVTIEPDSYLIVVLTTDVTLFEPYGSVIGLTGFSLNNEGSVVLRNPQGTLICSISYTDEWYNDDVKMDGGWSLEQIDPDHPCTGKENWIASSDLNGGTPGKVNSINNTTVSIPGIISADATSANTICVMFTHFMDSLSVICLASFSIDEGMGHPITAVAIEDGFNSVILGFAENFEENVVYHLTITDTIFNCAGDFIELNSTITVVLPAAAKVYEIVINEIMADPDPPVGLPEYEFIELYNTTDSFLKMNGWSLQVGTSFKPLPGIVMAPNEYIILTEDDASELYGMLARSFGFSSLGLSNTGTSLKLLDQDSVIISSVSFRENWYNDSEKCEGGWSLEQIDPSNPCPGKDNWTVSMDERGGSPGIANSVNSQNFVEPVAVKVIALDNKTFEVHFNQMMDEQSLLNPASYSVDRGIGNPLQSVTDGVDMELVILEFSQQLETRKLYTLTLTGDIQSCIGQTVPENFEILFGIPETAESNDVIINEVLFNPADDCEDFVEIYNRTEKIIDLSDLMLGTIEVNQLEPNDTAYKSVSDENSLLLSGTYIVLTLDPLKVLEQYFTTNPAGFIGMSSFPAYNNDAGAVILVNSGGSILDAFNYEESMHYPLLNSFEGVSLERINFERLTQDRTNWHSASSDCGFATPGFKNSQYSESSEMNDEITIEPEIFSPDNDGFDDIVNINYKFDSPGYSCSITIYDAQGRLINYLVRNELLGTEGTFSWDGRTTDNCKADIGIYVVYIEAFDMAGKVKKIKKVVVVGGKL